MALILNIDTSLENASVSLASDGLILQQLTSNVQKEHAAFLHNAIRQLLTDTATPVSALDAIATVSGPGSYTGLRVGMATAKGLCYALNRPFITLNTLSCMAAAAINEYGLNDAMYCPVIDARRSEVYTALYDAKLKELQPPQAYVVNGAAPWMDTDVNMLIFGNGSSKFAPFARPGQQFVSLPPVIPAIAALSFHHFQQSSFTELAHSQPFYVKEFFDNK